MKPFLTLCQIWAACMVFIGLNRWATGDLFTAQAFWWIAGALFVGARLCLWWMPRQKVL